LEAFTTKNQGDFLNRQRELWVTAFNGGDDVTIDLDKIASELPENRPTWVPREQTQQFQFRCEMCESVTDILGEYGSCPRCGHRNSFGVLKKHLERLDKEFKRADAELQDRFERGNKWQSLLPRYISEFEAMADDKSVKLNQAIRVGSDEVARLSRLDANFIQFGQVAKGGRALLQRGQCISAFL